MQNPLTIAHVLPHKDNSRKKVYGDIGLPEILPGQPAIDFIYDFHLPTGLNLYRKMRYTDPIVGGIMLNIEAIFTALEFEIFGTEKSFILENIAAMSQPIHYIFSEISTAFTYGFYIGEKIFKTIGNRIFLVDIAPRFQPTIEAIDVEGNLVRQLTDKGNFDMPYRKCMHHTFFSESRHPYGQSLLRHVYKPYYYKVTVEAAEAMNIDRDLSGLPMMQAPEGFDFTRAVEGPSYDPTVAATLKWALDLVSRVRNDNTQGVVIPFGWSLEIIKGDNRTVTPIAETINRYNTEIAVGLISNFLFSAKKTDAETQIGSFLNAIDSWNDRLAVSFSYTFNQLLRLNNLKPDIKMKFNKLQRPALQHMASFVSRLVDKGAITPTTELETALLNFADLPQGKNPMPPKPTKKELNNEIPKNSNSPD